MRSVFSAISLVIFAVTFSSAAVQAEEVRCQAIRDSAQCVAEPNCWYDAANNKGCLPGPRPDEDRCAVHSSESTCNTSSFGCAWDGSAEKCASRAG